MAIPVHILSGFLGSGKTSAIRYQLAERKDERVAVIVNDFGEAGFDEAVIEGEAPFQITNIPGACVCCTAPEGFVAALGAILADKPDRLLIEPTGLARPQDLVDTIRRGPHRNEVELMPVVVLVDPRKLTNPSEQERALIEEQAEVADILVANQTDRCSESELAAFDAWAQERWPAPLQTLHTSHGQVSAAVMEWPPDEGPRLMRKAEDDDHAHHHSHADSTDGFTGRSFLWSPEVVFERSRLEAAIEVLARGGGSPTRLSRFKGLFRTREGTFRIEWAANALDVVASAHRRDSRADAIVSGHGDGLLDEIESVLSRASLSEAELRARANEIEFVLPDESARVLARKDLAGLPHQVDDVSALFPKRTGTAAPMSEVLDQVSAPSEGHAVICAADGFASEPVGLEALRQGVLLHSDDGGALSDKKGGPFRLLIPDDVPDAPSACANVKAVTRIVVRSA